MRILMIGTTHDDGSFTDYLDRLNAGLVALGASVDRIGLPDAPLDRSGRNFWPGARIEAAARELIDDVTLTDYDLIALHYGNFEVEQLLPYIWRDRPHPPVVSHAHHIDWSLFKDHVPDERRYRQVLDGVAEVDGHVHYCTYSKDVYADRHMTDSPAVVSFYPSATADLELAPEMEAGAGIEWSLPEAPLLSMCGFVNPWKNVACLIDALSLVQYPVRVILAGPGWEDAERIGIDLNDAIGPKPRRIGNAEFALIPEFLDVAQRTALVRASTAGVFPYTDHMTFQGSGAVTAYLAAGVPVIASDVGSFAELIGGGGTVVEADNPALLAAAIDETCSSPESARATKAVAMERASMFTPERHASECFEFYEEVVASAQPVRRAG